MAQAWVSIKPVRGASMPDQPSDNDSTMANGDSVSVTVQNFLSRIEAETQLEDAVKAAFRRLVETSQLSSQDAIESAIREEEQQVGEAEAPASEGSSRPT